MGNYIKWAFWALLGGDVTATLGLWSYLYKQAIVSPLLYGLAAAWVLAIALLVMAVVYLVSERNGFGETATCT